MRPLDFISLSSKMMKAYEAACQPVCKKYQLNQTCQDVILFLANNPEYNTAKDLWKIRGIRSGQEMPSRWGGRQSSPLVSR